MNNVTVKERIRELTLVSSVVVAGIGRTVSYFKLRYLADPDFSCEDPLPFPTNSSRSLTFILQINLLTDLSIRSLLLDRAMDLHRADPWRCRRLSTDTRSLVQRRIPRVHHSFHPQSDQSSLLALSQRFPQKISHRDHLLWTFKRFARKVCALCRSGGRFFYRQ